MVLLPAVWGATQSLKPVKRGVNLTGAEWISEKDFRRVPIERTSRESLKVFTDRGLNLFRFCFRWESLQPKPLGPLNAQAVAVLRSVIQDAHSLGAEVILDPHNSARYTMEDGHGKLTTLVIGEKDFPHSIFADFWRRMALEFCSEPGIYGYGLMNEPNNIVTHRWEAASQAAVDAIRSTGDRHLILVPGSNYSSAHIWVMCHGPEAWIRDPLNNFAYEAHCYVDSPRAPDYLKELQADPELPERALNRLGIFVDWCHENGVRGFIGEFGSIDHPGWLDQFESLLLEMDRVHLDGTAWCAGDRCLPHAKKPSMPYVLQPGPGYSHTGLEILTRHGSGKRTSLFSDIGLGYEIAFKRFRFQARKMKRYFRNSLRLAR